jgi:AbrB family looped-hinge helix DNA binding protein
MPHYQARMSSNDQLTIPSAIREHFDLKAGDIVDFYVDDADGSVRILARNKSIFDSLDSLKLPSIRRPVTREDIDAAIAEEMDEQERRIRGQRR